MADKDRNPEAERLPRREPPEASLELRARLRTDLERRGVTPELAAAVLDELAVLADGVGPGAREGLLSGVAVAFGAVQDGQARTRESLAGLGEIQRLMDAFAGELGKLDEALKTLAAYLERMRRQAEGGPARVLH